MDGSTAKRMKFMSIVRVQSFIDDLSTPSCPKQVKYEWQSTKRQSAIYKWLEK